MKILLIFILTINISFGQESKFLKKDSLVPFDGYLVTPQRVEELRKGILERDKYKLLNESLEKSLSLEKTNNELQEKKVTLLTEQNDRLGQTLGETRNSSDFNKILWFSLGIIATGLAIYGAKQLQK